MKKRALIIATVSVLAVVLVGCPERTRDDYVADMAKTSCDRFDECDNLGEHDDAYYETYSECISEMESSYYDAWPSDECSDGQINIDEWKDCRDRARNFPCDANIFDVLSFASDCSAENVCTDPRN